VNVKDRPQQHTGSEGVLSVLDSGPGIPLNDRPRIFDRFWRGKGARSEGAGLGLAIVMEIVRAHGASSGARQVRHRQGNQPAKPSQGAAVATSR